MSGYSQFAVKEVTTDTHRTAEKMQKTLCYQEKIFFREVSKSIIYSAKFLTSKKPSSKYIIG